MDNKMTLVMLLPISLPIIVDIVMLTVSNDATSITRSEHGRRSF